MTSLWAAVFLWPRGRTPARGGVRPAGFWSKNHKAGELFWGIKTEEEEAAGDGLCWGDSGIERGAVRGRSEACVLFRF